MRLEDELRLGVSRPGGPNVDFKCRPHQPFPCSTCNQPRNLVLDVLRPRTLGLRPPLPQVDRPKNAPTTLYKGESGSWTSGIIWEEGELKFFCNRLTAENRLANLKRRFQRQKEFERCYRKAVLKYQQEVYKRKILDKADAARTDQHFLQHHGVLKKSTNSSENKVRVIFDSTASFNGKCLNDALLTGPVLQTQLPKISTKFREGQVTFTADIEAMFSRIRLTPEDTRFQGFPERSPVATRSKCCRRIASPSVASAPRTFSSASSSVSPKSSGNPSLSFLKQWKDERDGGKEGAQLVSFKRTIDGLRTQINSFSSERRFLVQPRKLTWIILIWLFMNLSLLAAEILFTLTRVGDEHGVGSVRLAKAGQIMAEMMALVPEEARVWRKGG